MPAIDFAILDSDFAPCLSLSAFLYSLRSGLLFHCGNLQLHCCTDPSSDVRSTGNSTRRWNASAFSECQDRRFGFLLPLNELINSIQCVMRIPMIDDTRISPVPCHCAVLSTTAMFHRLIHWISSPVFLAMAPSATASRSPVFLPPE
jgi:hypothetical protein